MARLCLNCIVKNESVRVERMLKSVAPYISCYAITDTGSTDNTIEVIEKFFAERNIPGAVSRYEFTNWEETRNYALTAAVTSKLQFDYLLLCDADMELCVS